MEGWVEIGHADSKRTHWDEQRERHRRVESLYRTPEAATMLALIILELKVNNKINKK